MNTEDWFAQGTHTCSRIQYSVPSSSGSRSSSLTENWYVAGKMLASMLAPIKSICQKNVPPTGKNARRKYIRLPIYYIGIAFHLK